MTHSGETPRLSVVVPVYNEAAVIRDVAAEALEALAPLGPIELIIVDDGSDDAAADALADLARATPHMRVIRHPRRSGKSAALRTGVVAARAVWVGTMDGDGQDDPRDLLAMAQTVDLSRVETVGLVGGVRQNRTDGGSRKLASRLANGLRRSLLKDDCPDTACGLKLIPRDVFRAIPFFDAVHRYLPAFTRHLGFETRYVPVTNRPRTAGVSKYSNLGRAAAGLFDLMGVVWLMRRGHTPGAPLLLTAPAGRDVGTTATATGTSAAHAADDAVGSADMIAPRA